MKATTLVCGSRDVVSWLCSKASSFTQMCHKSREKGWIKVNTGSWLHFSRCTCKLEMDAAHGKVFVHSFVTGDVQFSSFLFIFLLNLNFAEERLSRLLHHLRLSWAKNDWLGALLLDLTFWMALVQGYLFVI